MVKNTLYGLLFFFVVQGYGQQLVSYVSLNATEPYVGQPVQMTVSVYTNTWFTQGVEIGNIQVEGALTVYFRSVSNKKTFSGKNFSGVDFIYNLYPTRAGELIISPLSIKVESPRPGNPTGIKHTIATKQRNLTVKEIPLGYDPNNWLVSSSLNITDKWNAPLKNVKVGDVLQRTISRSAGGTLGEFIPAIVWDSVPGISIYPKRPLTRTTKTKTYVSAFRSETVNYLFEKEGTIILPRMEFSYWNDRYNKYYKKVIDSITINVAPNADLGMLAGIKEKLSAETKMEEAPEEKAKLIFGMTWKEFLKILVIGAVLLFAIYKLIKWAYSFLHKRYIAYLYSEKHAFKKVISALNIRNVPKFFNVVKLWLLKLNLDEDSLHFFIEKYGSTSLEKQYALLKKNIFNGGKDASTDYFLLRKELKAARKKYIVEKKENHDSANKGQQKNWLNPIVGRK